MFSNFTVEEFANTSDADIGKAILVFWIVSTANSLGLDPSNHKVQENITLLLMGMDNNPIDDAGIDVATMEKIVSRAAQGEFAKAGEMFRSSIWNGAHKRIEKRNNQIILNAANDLLDAFKARKIQDKQRVENRQDQKDKRAFQEAVTANIDDYSIKADAIRDLRIKPQFEKYPDKTLNIWITTDIWNKPKQIGRPKKQ
jgi:hypothetical protein